MIDEDIINDITMNISSIFDRNNEYFSMTRDIFSARMQSYIIESKKYLESAIISEIGNNTFDHNFIYSEKRPWGVYCNLSYDQKHTVLADFGRGVRQSLLTVVPEIKTDIEAVEIAFTKRISGRMPEQRGNGLKFVSDIIIQNNWQLFFQSGTGCCSINKSGIEFYTKENNFTGCLVIIKFEGEK
ncbi:hypothetical protein AGMMS49928_29350 [Spirochaetia bacterium]|nr:hypothetical protein AGMMS49928_29350 [Spirochaetia bacterium]